MKAPTSNLQAPEKHQEPNTDARIPRSGRDGAPAPSAPLSGATLRENYAKGFIYSARSTGGDGASAPSLPDARPRWCLMFGISLELGIWSLELFPALVGRVTMSVISSAIALATAEALATTDPCAPKSRHDLRSINFRDGNMVHPLPEGEGRGEGEQCSTILNEHKFSKTPPLGFSAPSVPR